MVFRWMKQSGCSGYTRSWALLVLAAVILASGLTAPAEAAARREDPLAGLTSKQRKIFKNYTRLYCKQFFRYEDRFVLLPNYKRARENSAGRSYEQAFEEMTKTKIEYRRTPLGKKKIEVKITPPEEEVFVAAKVIPAVDVGHYGVIDSASVEEIVGPEEMIVTDIRLISPGSVGYQNNKHRKAARERQLEYSYRSYRLLGFSTEGLDQGSKYRGPKSKGLKVAVISTDTKHSFVLVNYDDLKPAKVKDFPAALAYVKIEPLDFIDLVRENRMKLSTEGDKASLLSIYKRYYSRYRPTRVSSEPPARKPEVEPERKPELSPEPERKPEPETQPEPEHKPEPERQPEPRPERKPEPKPEDEPEDDWEHEEDSDDSSDEPTFFGIPL